MKPIPRAAVAGVVLLAFALRVLHLSFALRSPLTFQPAPDEEYYLRFGRAAAAGAADDPLFAFMDPAYGYLAGAVFGVLGERVVWMYFLQILLDTATTYGVYRVGCLLERPRAGLIGALLYALASPAILLTTTLLKESWVSALMVLWTYAALRAAERPASWRFCALGLLSGVSIALRSNLALLPLFTLALLPFTVQPGSERRTAAAARFALVFALGLSLPLAFLAQRNERLSGAFSPFPTNGGVVLHQLYNAENPRAVAGAPAFVNYYEPASIWRGYASEAERRLQRPLSPSAVSDYWRGLALEYVFAHPDQLLANALRKCALFLAYDEIPNNRSMADERMFSPVLRTLPMPFGWLFAFGLPGLALAIAERRRALLTLVPVAACLITVALFFAEDRFRAPAATMLALGAGWLIDWFPAAWRAERRRALGAAVSVALIGAASLAASQLATPQRTAWDRVVWGYVRMGELERAAALAAEHAPREADNASLEEALGFIAGARGKNEEAIAHYRRAIAIRPGAHVAHYNLARALEAMGDLPQALAHARRAAELAPDPDYAALARQLSDRTGRAPR